MLKIAIPHRTYSENKVKIKNIIKKYGMSWDSGKNGWVNRATGDGVYIDKAVMDMILSDSFSGDMPMTMFVDSSSEELIGELSEKVRAIGGTITEEAPPETLGTRPASMPEQVRKTKAGAAKRTIHVRLGARDPEGCTTPEFAEKAEADLKDISRRWERRREQILRDFERTGMDRAAIDRFLRREEIAFRKANACWVTGEFPSVQAENGDDG
jgi:hypothetical protein